MIVSSEEFADMISEDVQDEVVRLTRAVFKGVTKRTPILTGQTVRSWNVSKNEPNTSVVSTGTGHSAKRFPPINFKAGEYPLLFVANSKDHIYYLEEGTPHMAPRKMVALTLAEIDGLG